jgi:HrpA-like RNA helicase
MVKGLGGGTKYRVSAPEDITEYLRQASLEKLGRTMSKADVDKAIAAIQQVERTKGPDAPAMSVAAAQQVSAADPDREKSVRFRRGIDIAMNLLGG